MWGTREYARRHDLYLPIEKPMCSDDTHIRSCGVFERCIDSRVREQWDIEYYVNHHMVGGFFNDARGTGKRINAKYVTAEMRS